MMPMKSIKVTVENRPSIEAAIAAVAGKKKSFVHSCDDVFEAVESAEKRLARFGLAKAHRRGASARSVLEGPAKSYKYRTEGTVIHLVRKSDGWSVSETGLTSIYPGSSARLDLKISKEQEETAVDAAKRDLKISVHHAVPASSEAAV